MTYYAFFNSKSDAQDYADAIWAWHLSNQDEDLKEVVDGKTVLYGRRAGKIDKSFATVRYFEIEGYNDGFFMVVNDLPEDKQNEVTNFNGSLETKQWLIENGYIMEEGL